MHKNNIKNELDHNVRYPDFPEKRQIIEFDAKKIKNCSKKLNLNYKIKKQEIKKISSLGYAKLTLKYFKKLEEIIKDKELYNTEILIKEIIEIYKNCYLLSVKKMAGKQRHFRFQKILKKTIKKIQ